MSADSLADAVRQAIQKSDIPAGEWLREVRLCNEYGVGRSTVRRALRILADDGLIELAENRGARVLATSAEEVFDLYEVRAALYGLAARFTCLRGSDEDIAHILGDIDQMLADAEKGLAAEAIITESEAIFTQMAACASADTQRMIEAVRRKTRFHFSYAALALNAKGEGPFGFWRQVRAALVARDANAASQGARDILYFMQGEVARIMLAQGSRVRTERPAPAAMPVNRRAKASRRA